MDNKNANEIVALFEDILTDIVKLAVTAEAVANLKLLFAEHDMATRKIDYYASHGDNAMRLHWMGHRLGVSSAIVFVATGIVPSNVDTRDLNEIREWVNG